MPAYLNRIGTATPPHDTHEAFVGAARRLLDGDRRHRHLFERMVDKSQIAHRYSVLSPLEDGAAERLDPTGFYPKGRFPTTGERMKLFEHAAPELALRAIERLELADDRRAITHLVVTCCTGFYAPGLDVDIVDRCGLKPDVERTIIGFMGCHAAINGLKLAHHAVLSDPDARVLMVNLELCTLHLKETLDLETLLSFLIFADGCAASVVSSDPTGFRLDRFHSTLVPETRDLLTWKVRDGGFDMVLSGRVPGTIQRGLETHASEILAGADRDAIDLWAVHPGGRTILDAVEHGLALAPPALDRSRQVLHDHGNMSSPTVMFVLESMLRDARMGQRGCGMAFGPGMTAETVLFEAA